MRRSRPETGVENMKKRKKAITSALIREEIRKLNLIGKSEIHRSFDEEAAIDLVLRFGLTRVPEVEISPVIKYRLLVGGLGIAYEGASGTEGRRHFSLFVTESKIARSKSAAECVTLFRDFEVLRSYTPPE